MAEWSTLPVEMQWSILSWLSLEDLAAICQVSKDCANVALDQSLIRAFFQRVFGYRLRYEWQTLRPAIVLARLFQELQRQLIINEDSLRSLTSYYRVWGNFQQELFCFLLQCRPREQLNTPVYAVRLGRPPRRARDVLSALPFNYAIESGYPEFIPMVMSLGLGSAIIDNPAITPLGSTHNIPTVLRQLRECGVSITPAVASAWCGWIYRYPGSACLEEAEVWLRKYRAAALEELQLLYPQFPAGIEFEILCRIGRRRYVQPLLDQDPTLAYTPEVRSTIGAWNHTKLVKLFQDYGVTLQHLALTLQEAARHCHVALTSYLINLGVPRPLLKYATPKCLRFECKVAGCGRTFSHCDNRHCTTPDCGNTLALLLS